MGRPNSTIICPKKYACIGYEAPDRRGSAQRHRMERLQAGFKMHTSDKTRQDTPEVVSPVTAHFNVDFPDAVPEAHLSRLAAGIEILDVNGKVFGILGVQVGFAGAQSFGGIDLRRLDRSILHLLRIPHVRVHPARLNERLVGPLFHNNPFVHDEDMIGINDCGQPVRDIDSGPIAADSVQSSFDNGLDSIVECTCSFIENKDPRICDDRAGQRDALSLSWLAGR